MNTKPQLSEAARKVLTVLAERPKSSSGQHPDGPVTFPNAEVLNVDTHPASKEKGSFMVFVVDLNNIAQRGDKPCTSKEGTVEKGPNIGQVRGGNLMLATLNEPIKSLKLGALGGDFDIRCNLNLTIQPRK